MDIHKESIKTEHPAASSQVVEAGIPLAGIYIAVKENASAEDLRLLYADTFDFCSAGVETILEKIQSGVSIYHICSILCRPAMLVIDAGSFAGRENSQTILLNILNERQRLHRNTFLLFETEPDEKPTGFIGEIVSLLIDVEHISLRELLDRKYNLFPAINLQEYTDCLVKDIVIDHESEFLVCECYAGADQKRTVVAIAERNTGRYLPASDEDTRRILQIYALKQQEARKIEEFFGLHNMEQEQRKILFDLKANQARRKAGLELAKL